MIHSLTGTVVSAIEQQVVLSCGPISLLLQTPDNAVSAGKTVTLCTYMHWSSEQGPTLYGFTSELERTVFLLIISCSGMGPKIALALLSDLGATTFLQAVHTGQEQLLTKVAGVGAKKAEQLIVHLRHKVSKLLESGMVDTGKSLEQWTTITQVLQSLNYSRSEIAITLKQLNEQPEIERMPFDQIMRTALSFLAKKT